MIITSELKTENASTKEHAYHQDKPQGRTSTSGLPRKTGKTRRKDTNGQTIYSIKSVNTIFLLEGVKGDS